MGERGEFRILATESGPEDAESDHEDQAIVQPLPWAAKLMVAFGGLAGLLLAVCIARFEARSPAEDIETSGVLLLADAALRNLTQVHNASGLRALLQCEDTCFSRDCNFWNQRGHTCKDLQEYYKCDCSGCSRCQPSCPNTCQGQSCEFWEGHGYRCHDLEAKFGCDCKHCACRASPAPAASPPPASSGRNCEGIRPTHYYPLPRQTYTRGVPRPLLAHPRGMTMCDVKHLQEVCVSKINEMRAGARFSDGRIRHHGQLQPLAIARNDFGKCMNEKALSDLRYSVHHKKGCGHFTLSRDCGLNINAMRSENSCCPRRCHTLAGCKKKLLQCLQQMWDEGKIVLDTANTRWTHQTGHYWNIVSRDSTHVGCGFGFDSQGHMLAMQNFY